MSKFLVAAVLFGSCFFRLSEASPPAANPVQSKPGMNTEGDVSIDFVVRDKHGHELRDLRPDEIQIEENSTPVKIKAVRLHNAAGKTGPEQGAHLISIVFDDGETGAAALVRDAIPQMFKQFGSADVYFSVWRIRNGLDSIHGFTHDEAALREAVQSTTRARHRGSEEKGISPSDVRPDLTRSDGITQKQLNEVALKIVKTSEEMVRIQHASPIVGALIAMARQEKSLPGRKAILYISDGLRIGTTTTDQLRAVAAEANRSQVSIYTVDMSGVSQKERDDAAQMVMSTLGFSSIGPGTSMASAADRAADLGMADSNDSFKRKTTKYQNTQLQNLAAIAGGTCMTGSSDVRKFVRNMVEDLTSYYEATYSVANVKYDGHFLPLRVKIDRPQVRVQSPAGYFAVPPGNAADVEAFELPLLKALTAPERTETIWFDGAVMRSSQADVPGADLLVQIPLNGLLAHEDDNTKIFRLHLSIVALVKDTHGNILRNLGQDIGLTGALEQLQQARKDTYTFERPFAIGPGEYHVDLAIGDRNAEKISTKTITFSIPAAQAGPTISGLFVVRRLEAPASKLDLTGLLRYNGMRVVPDLNSRQKRMGDARHPVFFDVFPDSKGSEKLSIEVDLIKNNTYLAKLPIQVPALKPGEPVPVLASFDKHPLAPGDYRLLAKITQGAASREQQVSFSIAPEIGEDMEPESALKEDDHPETAAYKNFAILPKLIENASRPSPSDIQAILSGARERVVDYKRTLPNFVCMRVTRRFVDPAGHGTWKSTDSYTEPAALCRRSGDDRAVGFRWQARARRRRQQYRRSDAARRIRRAAEHGVLGKK